jgi:hypothetical protein
LPLQPSGKSAGPPLLTLQSVIFRLNFSDDRRLCEDTVFTLPET